MILSLQEQAKLFLLTVLLGGGLGVFYDGLRIFRRMLPHSRFWVQAEDGLFWFTAVFLVFGVMLRASGGEVRFFSIFGLFGGMGLYFLTASRLVMAVSDRLIRVVRYTVGIFLQILLTPIHLVWLLLRHPVMKIGGFCEKQRKKLLHSVKLYVKMKLRHLRMAWKIFRR